MTPSDHSRPRFDFAAFIGGMTLYGVLIAFGTVAELIV